jgi:hypothetical protein
LSSTPGRSFTSTCPDRGRGATHGRRHTIPRDVAVGRDGKILFQSFGFEKPDFEKMIEVISSAVGRGAK